MYLHKTLLWITLLLVSAIAMANTTVIQNVTVITMTEAEPQSAQTVIVRGDRIVSITDSADAEYSETAKMIDGSGKFLMPGLAEMHGHTPVPNGNTRSDFVKNMMFLYAANGVTTIRGMLGSSAQLKLRDEINTGESFGPTLYLAGPSFNGNSISSPEQARRKVEKQVKQGWDLLKVHPGLSRPEYDAMANTAHQLGISFGGHVPQDVGLQHAIAMGQLSFDHIDGYLEALDYPAGKIDSAQLEELVKLSRKHKVWIVPTLELWNHLIGLGTPDAMLAWPEMQFWPPSEVANWKRRMLQSLSEPATFDRLEYSAARNQVLIALHKAEVGILLGTDSPQLFSVPGFSIHREMQRMVEAGLSPFEVLVTGTRNVGEYFKDKDAFGIIASGQRADMILLNSNPLENIAAVQDRAGVMIRGQWLSEVAIQTRFAEIRDRYKVQ